MVAPARSTHFSLSFKLGSFIKVNDLEERDFKKTLNFPVFPTFLRF